MVAAASVIYAAALLVVALSRTLALTIVLLLPPVWPGSPSWRTSTPRCSSSCPKWVRARGLALYQMVLFGAQAPGAVIWGVVAGAAGLVPAFVIAAFVMAAGAATIWFWPFYDVAGMDRSLVRWPEPQLVISPDGGRGPVLVRTAYTIAADQERQFLHVMAQLRRSRLRTGAAAWGLYQDGQNPRLFIELFRVLSWEEHLRQHAERITGADLQYHDADAALSEPPPRTEHYLAVTARE